MAKKKVFKDLYSALYPELIIEYNKPKQFVLSKAFIDRAGAWYNLEEIREAYWFKLMLYDMINDTNDPFELRSLAEDLKELEFYIQELFGFKPDEDFHRFWETPKCQCPSLDNMDRWPSGRYIISLTCPLHTNMSKSEFKRHEIMGRYK